MAEPSASASVVVPASCPANRPPKVVVYTPFVTVPALPVIEPLIVLLKMLVPLNVLLFASKVEDAAVITMFPVPSKVTPLMVRPVWRAVAVEALPVSEPVTLPITPPLALMTPPTLSVLLTVVEPVTASAVVVAPAKVAPPLNASWVVA